MQTKQSDFEERLSALEQAVVALTALVGKPAKPKPTKPNSSNESNADEPSNESDDEKPSGKFAALGGLERRGPHAFGLHGE